MDRNHRRKHERRGEVTQTTALLLRCGWGTPEGRGRCIAATGDEAGTARTDHREKTAELTDYMQSAVSLVKSYVPPDPAKIQATKDAGKVTIQVLDPGKRAQVNFHDYQKPGDNLAIVINLANNIVAGVGVSSYLDSATDVVTMDAKMGQLNDGTIYTSDIALNASGKNLTVTVQNTGY